MGFPWRITALVDRAASCSRPLNVQDSLLILKALYSLRFRGPSVRRVCERTAGALTSPRISVPVERVVESLNLLVSLQAASLPVVHSVLASRLMELSHDTASRQSIQKAAVTLVKMGRRYADPKVADHVFLAVQREILLSPSDHVLRLAAIALYQYTTFAAHPAERAGGQSAEGAPLSQADKAAEEHAPRMVESAARDSVISAAVFLIQHDLVRSLSGNNVLQALHLLPFLQSESVSDVRRCVHGGGYSGSTATASMPVDEWMRVVVRFATDLNLSTVVPGGFAHFLFDFMPVLLQRRNAVGSQQLAKVLSTLYHPTFAKALNSYDISKVIKAICSQPMDQLLLCDSNSTIGDRKSGDEVPVDMEEVVLRLFVSFVQQVQFFSRAAKRDTDEVALSSIWRFAQKYLNTVDGREVPVVPGADLKVALQSLIDVSAPATPGLSPAVTSWILYSCSKVARTSFFSAALAKQIDLLVEHILGFRKGMTLRSATQVLFAVSMLMVPSEDERALSRRCSTPARGWCEDAVVRMNRWGPGHPVVSHLAAAICARDLAQSPTNDIPMLLQAVANIAEAADRIDVELPPSVDAMLASVLDCLGARKGSRTPQGFWVDVACALVVLAEFQPCKTSTTLALKSSLQSLQAQGLTIAGLAKLLECVSQPRRCGEQNLVCLWVCEHASNLLCSPEVKALLLSPSPGTRLQDVLRLLEAAQHLGADVACVECPKAAQQLPRRTLPFCIGAACTFVAGEPFGEVAGGIPNEVTSADAAHVLRLLAHGVQRSGVVSISPQSLAALRHRALYGQPTTVATLLLLLSINTHQSPSKALFRDEDLEVLLERVLCELVRINAAVKRGHMISLREAERLIVTLLDSQVLLRTKHTISTLPEPARSAILDTSRAICESGGDSPENLLKLQLLV